MSSRTCPSFQPCPPALEQLTGHSHFIVVANGTTAIAALSNALAGDSGTVLLPALGCWSLTQGVLIGGAEPLWQDVDERGWMMEPAPSGLSLHIRPWFSDRERTLSEHDILDLSVNLSAGNGQESAAATLASLGPGKPGYWPHRGAFITTSSRGVIDAMADTLGMHATPKEWTRWAPRVTMVECSWEEMGRHVEWTTALQGMREEQAARLIDWILESGAPFAPLVSRPRGNSLLLPVRLLTKQATADLAAVASELNLPIGLQPVSPAYRQPAIAALTSVQGVVCPRAEDVAADLMFLAVEAIERPRDLENLSRLMDRWRGGVSS